MKISTTIHTFFAMSLALIFAKTATAQHWNSFQNGGSLQSENWMVPTEWSPEKGIAWHTKLAGYGQSSPVIADDVAYLTSVTGPNKETLNIEAISLTDGQRKWIFNHENSSPEENTVMVSRAAPTPVADADGVIAFFEGGNLFALDHAGELRWKRDLKAEFGEHKARHGLSASLEQDDEHVYLWCERAESPYVMSIKKNNGETAWKKPGLGNTSWSSPRLMTVDGKPQLILSSIGLIVGVDPSTGDRLWEFDKVASNSSSTPVPVGDGKFLMGASGSRGGKETIPSCGVISITSHNGVYAAKWDWVAEKASCSFGSPFAFDGKAWFVNRTGIVNCHDLQTGDKVFTARLGAGQIWATPLATKSGIYFFGKNGVTSIVEPNEKLKVVAENTLWKPDAPKENDKKEAESGPGSGAVLYAAAIAGDTLVMRRGDILYGVR
ncbi:outer membrane protein assembly factor BamB family protein [Mariniblastus fucicola]|uniref:Outer membrane biogenesis protein BamB n=1 Tax=Mariniblastus fucicola TaxID=980251 RepID=A0A5B9PP19_9BACT|nr:PQQ-binding-like beta-propeller repeat protein [Mariniblastus fucicola]QEG24301.1 outer membrane biogenesis protein BamB [Mariniblastus fucicola]